MRKVNDKKQAILLLIILIMIGGIVLFGNNRKIDKSKLLMKIYESKR